MLQSNHISVLLAFIFHSFEQIHINEAMRHNIVRDSDAQIMRVVCRDVQIGSTLLLITEIEFVTKSQYS